MRHDSDPGSKSAEEVQREVRDSRATEETLEATRDRLPPGQLFDQEADYLHGSGCQEFLRNLGATVRDKPGLESPDMADEAPDQEQLVLWHSEQRRLLDLRARFDAWTDRGADVGTERSGTRELSDQLGISPPAVG
jgi:hypothetical protein